MIGLLAAALISQGSYVPSGQVSALQGAAAAAGCFNVTPSLLAGEAQTESNMGTNNGPSSAGADGPFQFEPGTWQQFGQGGNVWSWSDAAYGAARALCAYSHQAARNGVTGNAGKDAYAECAYYSGPGGDVAGRESGVCASYIASVSASAYHVNFGGAVVVSHHGSGHKPPPDGGSGGGSSQGADVAKCRSLGGVFTGINASYMPFAGPPYQCYYGGSYHNIG